MTSLCPTIYGLSIENIKQKIKDMISLGYTKNQIMKMTSSLPQLYCYSIESIKQKIETIINLGYTKIEVIEMTKEFPGLLGFSVENIKEKIAFYDSIEMHDLAITNPKDLMQSIDLSYARYQFYLSKGIVVTMNNYKMLFAGNKIFEKQWNITKEELVSAYNYKKDEEKKMEELFNMGISEITIKSMIETNPELIDITAEEIQSKEHLLKNIKCEANQIRNIISSNPIILNRSNEELLELINYLIHLGFNSLSILFDSTPYILNLKSFEIQDYINKRKKIKKN